MDTDTLKHRHLYTYTHTNMYANEHIRIYPSAPILTNPSSLPPNTNTPGLLELTDEGDMKHEAQRAA